MADSLSCLEESANEAKVKALIFIQSNALSEREVQLQSPQIKSLMHTTALQICVLGNGRPGEKVWVSPQEALPSPRAETQRSIDMPVICVSASEGKNTLLPSELIHKNEIHQTKCL